MSFESSPPSFSSPIISDRVTELCKTNPEALTQYYSSLAQEFASTREPPSRYESACMVINFYLHTILKTYLANNKQFKELLQTYTSCLKACRANKVESEFLLTIECISSLLKHLQSTSELVGKLYYIPPYDPVNDTIGTLARDTAKYPLDVTKLESKLGRVFGFVVSSPAKFPKLTQLIEQSLTIKQNPLLVSTRILTALQTHIELAPWKTILVAPSAPPSPSRKRPIDLVFSTDQLNVPPAVNGEVVQEPELKRQRFNSEEQQQEQDQMDDDDSSSIKNAFAVSEDPLLAPPPAAIVNPDPILVSKLPTLDHNPPPSVVAAVATAETDTVVVAPEVPMTPWHVRFPNGFTITHGHMFVRFKRVLVGPNVYKTAVESSKNILRQLVESQPPQQQQQPTQTNYDASSFSSIVSTGLVTVNDSVH